MCNVSVRNSFYWKEKGMLVEGGLNFRTSISRFGSWSSFHPSFFIHFIFATDDFPVQPPKNEKREDCKGDLPLAFWTRVQIGTQSIKT